MCRIDAGTFLVIANFTMNCSNNMSVRGGVRQYGIYEWNGEGRILGMVPPRSRCKRTTHRCGNCGAFNHITIDCLALQTSTKASPKRWPPPARNLTPFAIYAAAPSFKPFSP
ncbi:hypothetical protein Ae201684P_003677 [Aphanomyces euteiches]|uniref:Uncharacterized protein n=1 Tax=Aphanomyces euteiches TaxID=100861 RepID=A0A6G0WAR6_9STRA|nr:hypothetical protein Ae201684_017746 [Aphanomyces euteiches]KAH9064898.1 hypothetical protein Ae201684P_003677 [Aphanomyces euteiches]